MSDVNVSGGEGTPTPTPSAPAEVTPSAPAPVAATPATPVPGQATPPDGYVPSYRLRETREAAVREAEQKWAQKEAASQARYEEMERKFQALAGIAPPPNPEVAAVRNQFGQLYPGLSKLEERAQDLEKLIERAGDLESQTSHYWQSYGRQTMDRLFDQASKSLGGPITDEGKRVLHSSFVGFVQSSPEMTARYANDPTIVDDFVKSFTSNFIDPARRGAAVQVAQRAPGALPVDSPGGAPRSSPAPQPQDLDERASMAWTLYNSNKK